MEAESYEKIKGKAKKPEDVGVLRCHEKLSRQERKLLI